jgi:hypothetical protein
MGALENFSMWAADRMGNGNGRQPMELAKAILYGFKDYIDGAQRREFSVPAWRREPGEPRSSLHDVWTDTRHEAFSGLAFHGRRNWEYLGHAVHQPDLIRIFLDEQPHITVARAPNDERMHATLQAAWDCIAYLHKTAHEVGVLHEVFADIYGRFERRMQEASRRWAAGDAGTRAVQTSADDGGAPFLIGILWDEVSAGAKEIAYAYAYGPRWQDGLRAYFEHLMKEAPSSAAALRAQYAVILERMQTAVEPDDLPPEPGG